MPDSCESACSASAWYALRVRSRFEKASAAILQNKGFRAYLPLYRSRRRWSDRIAEIDAPLFPGYVFCQFDVNDRRVRVLDTPGVIEIVGIGRTPQPIDDSEFQAVRTLAASGRAEPWPYLAAGSRVRVEAGAFTGVEGLVVEAKSNYRLVVSVSLLCRSISVEFDSAWLTPVSVCA